MILVQDQYRQNNRKNFENEFQYKQDTSKQLYSDSKEVWGQESGCEEEILTSGNETEPEGNLIYTETAELQEEIIDNRKQNPPFIKKKLMKNVRFESSDFNYVIDSSETTSIDNEYLQTMDCSRMEPEVLGHRRSASVDPESGYQIKEHFQTPTKQKWRNVDCGYEKKCSYERRPKSSPEKVRPYQLESSGNERRPNVGEFAEPMDNRQRMRRKDYNCGGCYHRDGEPENIPNEYGYKKPVHRAYKYEHNDDLSFRQRHGDYCDHYQVDETKMRPEKKNLAKIKPGTAFSAPPMHKHSHHGGKDATENESVNFKNFKKMYKEVPPENHFDNQSLAFYNTSDRYCQMEEYYDHNIYPTKTKKKTLEAVQEQQEQFSDSTYKVACTKYSSQTISGELSGFLGKRSSEKLTNSSQSDWMYGSSKMNNSVFGEKIIRQVQPVRVHKMRSRRTRMNRLKNGWKKAFVQTVRDGARNERVGVIVMGPKGPEFYSKGMKKPSGVIPFRKSKSFLDGGAKSFDVMTVDCKNVFLSSSEPGPRANYAVNDLVCPEEDGKMEERLAKFSKNLGEIVKNSEEKFYNSLANNEFAEIKNDIYKGAGEGTVRQSEIHEEKDETEEAKYPNFPFLPFQSMSPRVAVPARKPEKIVTQESKAMAEALNAQAKQYRESQMNLKTRDESFFDELKELQEKYTPPTEIVQETIDANLPLWEVKLDELTMKTDLSEKKMSTEKISETSRTKERVKKEGSFSREVKSARRTDERDIPRKDNFQPDGSVKSSEQISLSKQRRKKYYETTTLEVPGTKNVNLTNGSCEGDTPTLYPDKTQEQESGRSNKKSAKLTKWTESSNVSLDDKKETDHNLISEVFRDLVENGCAISQEESENLQSIFNTAPYSVELCSNDALSSISSGVDNTIRETKINVSPRTLKSPSSYGDPKVPEKRIEPRGHEKKRDKGSGRQKNEYFEEEKNDGDELDKKSKKNLGESQESEVSCRKVSKMKNYFDEKNLDSKFSKKVHGKHKESKSKRKIMLEDRMKLLREALPSIAAENEAAHLKQLKKYIDRFIDRVEASTSSEFRKKKENRLKTKGSASTDSSEVRVDARRILDFVSNPFRKISSDVTINIAKKLTDALVQEKCSKNQKNFPTSTKARKDSEDSEEEGMVQFESPSVSDPFLERGEELIEPTYLKQLKKMRNEHLNNILLEVRRLSELLRFLDRCNRLNV